MIRAPNETQRTEFLKEATKEAHLWTLAHGPLPFMQSLLSHHNAFPVQLVASCSFRRPPVGRIIRGTMHVYIVVGCKTPECCEVHKLKYLGPKGHSRAEQVELHISCPLTIDCPRCRESYDYFDWQARFRQVELPEAFLEGYSNEI